MSSPKKIESLLIYDGLLHHGRTIFKHGGRYYYKSTGINSNTVGMVYPFHGIQVKSTHLRCAGWFIKPRSGNIEYTLRKIMMNFPQSIWCKSDWYRRFNNFRQMYTSYKYGHPFWEGDMGLYIAEYFGFDKSLYRSLSIPKNVIEIENPNLVNKWLRY